jgi:copper chaperone CopZ
MRRVHSYAVLLLVIITGLTFAKTTETEITVKGMTCKTCETKVTKALQEIDGVAAVHVCSKKGSAKVEYDAEKTNVAALETAITSVGFTANETVAKNPHKCCGAHAEEGTTGCPATEQKKCCSSEKKSCSSEKK